MTKLVLILFAWLISSAAAIAADTPPTSRPATTQASYWTSERYRLVNEPGEIVSVLHNGMTVIAKRVSSPAVSVRAYAMTGGIYEGPWLGGGLSHLLEHLVAGGSTTDRTEAENRALLQQIGNNSNAYTTFDHTAYFINTTPEHMEQAVDLLAGWMLRARITPEEYAREYQVVQRELEMGKGEPRRQFWYMAMMNRYRVHPARVPVIGFQSVIQGLTRDDVYAYYRQAYQPGNLVFAVAGDIDPQQMLAAVQKHAGAAPAGWVFSHELPEEPPVLAPRTLVTTAPKIGQASLSLSFPSIKLTDPDLYALDALASVLGDGESSLLVEEIRDKRQLVSSIGASSYTPQFAAGSFGIHAQMDPARVAEATGAILEVIQEVKQSGVDPQRLERAKAQMRSAHIKNRQTAEGIASSLAGDFMQTGDPHFSDRYVERIMKVTPQDLREVARRYLDSSQLITTAMLPSEFVGAAGLPRAEDILRAAAPTTAPTAEQASDVTRIELENGLILLHKRMSATPLVTISMYALGGLTAEDAASNGIGNLAMEMLPRGTESRSAQQIAEFFDSIGGELNTGCGNNTWFWSANCLTEDFARTMEVFADVVNRPAFPEAELPPMRQRILAQIASQDADWLGQAMRYFRRTYFAPMHSPYQFQVIGTAENVTEFTADQLRTWYAQKVRPSRRVLAIYGDVTLEQARTLAAQHLGGGPKLSMALNPPATMPGFPSHSTDHPSIEIQRVEIQQTQQPLAGVIIGFDSRSIITEPASFPLTVAKTLSGGYGYPTGYLHETLRGQGLVYVVHDQNWPGRDAATPGTFLVYAGCDPAKVNTVVDLILENMARLQGTEQDMGQEWFGRAQNLIVTSDALQTETPSAQATQAALDELYGLGYDYHQKFAERIRAVSPQDVRQIARERLTRCTVTVCTPAPQQVNVATGTREYRGFTPVDLTPRGIQHDAGPVGGQ